MTAFSPGTSPPPVRMPIRRDAIAGHPSAPRATESVAVGCRRVGLTAGPFEVGDRYATCIIAAMNYELFMGEALAEAKNALALGERPIAAVAVVDEAMVARAHDRVQESNDPTAHAVVDALRESARKLGKDRLESATIR